MVLPGVVVFQNPRNSMNIAPVYQPVFRALGIDAQAVFTHPDIRLWRDLNDRQNCVLDTKWPDGTPVRFHIKRFPVSARNSEIDEVNGIRVLQAEDIPTVPLVGWGKLKDGRSFIITQDLAGFHPVDKLIASGVPFDLLLRPTAQLTAQLHKASLHHRDLYLCHFYAKLPLGAKKLEKPLLDLRLIDAARVGRLGLLGRQRWIVKDLAQFWFSTHQVPITQSQRMEWLDVYAEIREIEKITKLQLAIQRKSDWIAGHDAKLRIRQPRRNISIPDFHAPDQQTSE
ncbi:MAG: hypothetical protein JO353_04570 [Phycisphaerae bacterium]|nr:hypothetical protein [Phycisphaerae bacterium]